MGIKTSIIGLLGEHIEKSLSPFIHQHFIRYYSLNYHYYPFQIAVDDLREAILGVKALGIRGVNITIPFKERSMEFMDFIDPQSAKIGAINTVVSHNNRLYGYNTDRIGFKLPLVKDSRVELADKKAVVLGAGGAAKAVVFSLAEEGCSGISIFNRSLQNAQQIKKNFEALFPHCTIKVFSFHDKNMQKEINEADLIINTTPLGSWYYPEENPLPEYIKLPLKLFVYDLIYNPDRTPLLKKAEKNGNKTINGKAMLIYQAAESFYLWTDIRPDQKIMTHVLDEIAKKLYI
ncbi:MAG: shikimate dehydrogenase [Atribacterota bacterium]